MRTCPNGGPERASRPSHAGGRRAAPQWTASRRIGRRGTARQAVANNGSSHYIGTVVTADRVQTGLRIDRTVLKVLKALAEYLDMSVGDLVEGIALHAFEGRTPFTRE